MSFKLALDVGHFDSTFEISRPLDALFVQQVIVQAGGRLPEEVWPDEAKRHRIEALASARGRQVLGYVGSECVVLHSRGFLMLALGGSNLTALAFLRMMAAEGCTIWTEDGEATQSVLETLTATEARWAELKKA